jgi:hypothetical protein
MPFGDPWTDAQRFLVDVIINTWARVGSWPNYQFVAAKLEDVGLGAAEVLRSFPVLGERSLMSRSYGDVIFDHSHPYPREDSQVALSVSGLHRHPLGDQHAQAFVAVLRLAAERRKYAPMDPTKVVEVILTSDDVINSLPRWPEQILLAVGSLIDKEWPVGVRGTGSNAETGTWFINVGREATRYLDLTIERYLELVKQDVGMVTRPAHRSTFRPHRVRVSSRGRRRSILIRRLP